MSFMVNESYVNETRGARIGDSGWYEARQSSVGKLFLDCQREFGRCMGKMYRESKSSGDREVGWVFSKQMEYSDYRGRGDRYYTQEVWVEVRQVSE